MTNPHLGQHQHLTLAHPGCAHTPAMVELGNQVRGEQ